MDNHLRQLFENPSIGVFANPCKGIDTGNNTVFLRYWNEIDYRKFSIPSFFTGPEMTNKWVPYNKGGDFRKWFGNCEYVINWEGDGKALQDYSGSNLRNKQFYFHKGITWSTVTSSSNSFRYFSEGFLFDNGGSCLFADSKLYFIQAFLNSSVTSKLLSIQPTINTQPGTIGSLPLIFASEQIISDIAKQCIDIGSSDWDSYETSWDFQMNPLIAVSGQWSVVSGQRAKTSAKDVDFGSISDLAAGVETAD